MAEEEIKIASGKGMHIAGSSKRDETADGVPIAGTAKHEEMSVDDDMDIDADSKIQIPDQQPAEDSTAKPPPKSIENAERSVEGWVLIATGIHEEAREEDLQDFFADFGKVRNLHMNLDRQTGFVKGYALVEYENFDEAKAAVERGSGKKLLGKIIDVDFAFVQKNEESHDNERRRHRGRDRSRDRNWSGCDSYVPDRSSHKPGRSRELSPDRGF
ncbi:hypothetical protein LPJ77_004375 [Coemansia sp. RSA 2523]|nr:hypothetical protein LPJ58_003853 [Coemansia sp. RSA 1591]KAJ1759246.1 hypothetical protein LPJ69_003817 [Coemansia sp. RSA 1752]KAJ1775174.1 hypothetical protein LPJ54_003851 [Coemansia sp. RSA 1824]KAJ1785982.1 hypothetical protein LPJ67_003755 [Coemansia sp. RSA 1938]KAJ1805170.1 hypothetical protein LPJ77_004375 [Coemansia sp. RSA 2523]KAJ2118903.1 hypothetical protein GGH17_005683 [Coemansia sp. RSA 788]KAJ2145169.1 hypothetical protein IW142_002746 [Coemansia sp. RSA 564]KAJ2156639.